MSEIKLKNTDWDDIGEFIAHHDKHLKTRFFKTIVRFIREEQAAIDEYGNMETSLEVLNAPESLMKLFRHFRKDEIEHRNILMEIEKIQEYT